VTGAAHERHADRYTPKKNWQTPRASKQGGAPLRLVFVTWFAKWFAKSLGGIAGGKPLRTESVLRFDAEGQGTSAAEVSWGNETASASA
jgi:hypothetical protein